MDPYRFESQFLEGLSLPERDMYGEILQVLLSLESVSVRVTPVIARGIEFDQDMLEFRKRDFLDYLVYQSCVWYKAPLVRVYVKSHFKDNGLPHTDVVLAKKDGNFPSLARSIDAVLELLRIELPRHTFAVKEVPYDLDERVHYFSLGYDERKGSDFRSEILV